MELPYTSSIRNFPLMFSEMKRTALLICEEKTPEEILQLSVEKNIYQLTAEKRRREVAFRMAKRLSTISKPLIELLANGNGDEAKLVAFLAFMKADRLLFEYMVEVYSEKYHAGFEEVTDKDFLDFIDRKAQNSENVAKWSAEMLKNIRTKIKNTLITAELAKRTKDGFAIQKPLICEKLCSLLEESDRAYVQCGVCGARSDTSDTDKEAIEPVSGDIQHGAGNGGCGGQVASASKEHRVCTHGKTCTGKGLMSCWRKEQQFY